MTKQESTLMERVARFAFQELDAQDDVLCAKRSERTQALQAQWSLCALIIGRERALKIADEARKT